MTPDDARQLLEQYRAGVDAESRLLHQLADIALRQHDVTQASDLTLFNQVADTRNAIMRSLVTLEDELRSLPAVPDRRPGDRLADRRVRRSRRAPPRGGRPRQCNPLDRSSVDCRARRRRTGAPERRRQPRAWRNHTGRLPARALTPTRQREAGGQGGIGWVCGCVGPCQVAADTFLSADPPGPARAVWRAVCGEEERLAGVHVTSRRNANSVTHQNRRSSSSTRRRGNPDLRSRPPPASP